MFHKYVIAQRAPQELKKKDRKNGTSATSQNSPALPSFPVHVIASHKLAPERNAKTPYYIKVFL